jgi:glycosyltransferase involved in cell wall biosynthesis
VGWGVPAKGLTELVTAWALLDTPSRLRIIGPISEPYAQDLTAIADKALGELEIVGPVEHGEAMSQLAAADVCVLPSYTEGFPNVVLEAMALGKPVVATCVGAIPEMLLGSDDECGICIPPRDVNALHIALRQLATSKALRTALGTNGRRRVERNYSMGVVFRQYKDVWQQSPRWMKG